MIHGQSRVRRQEVTQEEQKRQDDQAQKVLDQTSYFLKVRKQEVPQPENPLPYSELLAKLCPEISTIYNYRRELLEDLINQNVQKIQDSQNDGNTFMIRQEQLQYITTLVELMVKELEMLTGLLKRHPKSYTIWSYREWIVVKSVKIDEILAKQEIQPGTQIQAVAKEFQLCAKMLKMDERNFHVWNYRNWLVTLSGQGNIEEFTIEKIRQNFSNFSAYHFRSKFFLSKYNSPENLNERVLQNSPCASAPLPLNLVQKELELIKEAIYIQPKEQGVYLYHKWLLGVTQPFGVIKLIKTDNQSLLVVLNKRVSNLNMAGYVIIVSDGTELNKNEEYTICTQNGKSFDHFYLISFKNIHHQLEIRFNNNLQIKNEDYLKEEQLQSRFFIPVTYVLVNLEVISSKVNQTTHSEILLVLTLLEENIEFIQSVLDEEKNLKYALLQKAILLGYKTELLILMSDQQEVMNTVQDVLDTYLSIEPKEQYIMSNIAKWTQIIVQNSINAQNMKYWQFIGSAKLEQLNC